MTTALDEIADAAASCLTVGRYDALAAPLDELGERLVAVLTEALRAPRFAVLLANLARMGTTGSAVQGLLSPPGANSVAALLIASAYAEACDDGVVNSLSMRYIADACDQLRGAFAVTPITETTLWTPMPYLKDSPVLGMLRIIADNPSSLFLGQGRAADSGILAAPAYRTMLGALAVAHNLPVGERWTEAAIRRDTDENTDATREARAFFEFLVAPDSPGLVAAEASRRAQLRRSLVDLITDPDVRAMQRGERGCDAGTDAALRSAAMAALETRRFEDPRSPAVYAQGLLRAFFWAADDAPLHPRSGDRGTLGVPQIQPILAPDDRLPDDDALDDDAAPFDDPSTDAGDVGHGHHQGSTPAEPHLDEVRRIPATYLRARRAVQAYPHRDRPGVIPLNDIARILHALTPSIGAGARPDLRQVGLLLLFCIALHTGIDPRRLILLRHVPESDGRADGNTDDDILIDCRVADGLLIYRSARDEELRPVKPATPGLYVPTDGLRRIALPTWLGTVVRAYATTIGSRPGDRIFVERGGDGHLIPLTLDALQAVIAAATAASPRRAHWRHLPATFWTYHVADRDRLDPLVAYLISDHGDVSLRNPAYYTTVAVDVVGRALRTAVGDVRGEIADVARALGLPVLDARALDAIRDALTPPDVTTVTAGTVGTASHRLPPLPALGSSFLPQATIVETLFTHLRQRIGVLMGTVEDGRAPAALVTARVHNLVTAYLMLGFALLTALRPFEMDDVLVDLVDVAASGPTADPAILARVLMVEAKGNVHADEDRCIPLGTLAAQIVRQAHALPLRRLLIETGHAVPAPLRGRLFYLVDTDGALHPADERGLKRVLHEELDDRLTLSVALRLYDFRHIVRSYWVVRGPLAGLAGAWETDALMGHRSPAGWQDAFSWPAVPPWVTFGPQTLRDLFSPSAFDDRMRSLARDYGYEPLSVPDQEGKALDTQWNDDANRQRLRRDREALQSDVREVGVQIQNNTLHVPGIEDARQKRQVARALGRASRERALPYLTPRGVRDLVSSAAAWCHLPPEQESLVASTLTRLLCRRWRIPHPRASIGKPSTGRLDVVNLAVMREAPLWSLRLLSRRLTRSFPRNILVGESDADLVAALAILAVLEEAVVLNVGWSDLISPEARVLIHENQVWIAPHGSESATPPWRITPGSHAHLIALSLAYRAKRRGALTTWLMPDSTWPPCIEVMLVPPGETRAVRKAVRAAWAALCAKENLPVIPLHVVDAWVRFGAIQSTAPLSVTACGGADLYATSVPPSHVILPAYRSAYARPTRQGKAGDGNGAWVVSPPLLAIVGAAPSPRDALVYGPLPPSTLVPLSTSSMGTVEESEGDGNSASLLLDLQHRVYRLRQSATVTPDQCAGECIDVVARTLGTAMPRIPRDDAWWRAMQDKALDEPRPVAEANALLLYLWVIKASLTYRTRPWTVTTLADYAGVLVRFVRSLGDIPLYMLMTEDVADFLGRYASRGACDVVRAAIFHLLDDLPSLRLGSNVDRGDPSLHRHQRRTPMILVDVHVFAAYLHANDPTGVADPIERGRRLRNSVIAILGHMGLRAGEVYRLEIRHVEVGRGPDGEGDGYVLIERSKRGTTRRVPLRWFPENWRNLLIQWTLHRRHTTSNETAPLIVRDDGTRQARPAAMVRQVVKDLRARCGQPLTFHDLRGSCANMLFAQGHDARSIAVLLGHASVLSTFYYLHLLDQYPPARTALPWADSVVTVADLARLTGAEERTVRDWGQRDAMGLQPQSQGRAATRLEKQRHSKGIQDHHDKPATPGRPPLGFQVDNACVNLHALVERGLTIPRYHSQLIAPHDDG
jgi:integrase